MQASIASLSVAPGTRLLIFLASVNVVATQSNRRRGVSGRFSDVAGANGNCLSELTASARSCNRDGFSSGA